MHANIYDSRDGSKFPTSSSLRVLSRRGTERAEPFIVGSALATESAVQAIRETGESGSVLVVSDEADPPYNRSPLSEVLSKEAPGCRHDLATDRGGDCRASSRHASGDSPYIELTCA
jgi:hypothetical protein